METKKIKTNGGGVGKLNKKVSDKTIKAFGLLDFEQMQQIFNVTLFGLNEDDTDNLLDELRSEWKEKSKEERVEILSEYGIKYAKGGGVGVKLKANITKTK